MSYKLQVAVSEVFDEKKYVNADGNTECVEFIRQAAGAPRTLLWTKGDKVMDAKKGAIMRGAAIATFDEKGHFPTDANGKHAAIYLWYDARGIRVLDQWNSQDRVRERTIYLARPKFPRVDCATHYFVIE